LCHEGSTPTRKRGGEEKGKEGPWYNLFSHNDQNKIKGTLIPTKENATNINGTKGRVLPFGILVGFEEFGVKQFLWGGERKKALPLSKPKKTKKFIFFQGG